MAKTKEHKAKRIDETKAQIEGAKSIIFTDYRGLKVIDLEDLRKQLREKGGKIEITKNTLAKIAFNGNDKFSEIVGKSALAMAYSNEDEVGVPKAVKNFSKDHENLEIIGGFYEGEFLDKEAIERLADIPSKEELLTKLLMVVKGPIYGLHGALNNFAPRLVQVLKAIEEK